MPEKRRSRWASASCAKRRRSVARAAALRKAVMRRPGIPSGNDKRLQHQIREPLRLGGLVFDPKEPHQRTGYVRAVTGGDERRERLLIGLGKPFQVRGREMAVNRLKRRWEASADGEPLEVRGPLQEQQYQSRQKRKHPKNCLTSIIDALRLRITPGRMR